MMKNGWSDVIKVPSVEHNEYLRVLKAGGGLGRDPRKSSGLSNDKSRRNPNIHLEMGYHGDVFGTRMITEGVEPPVDVVVGLDEIYDADFEPVDADQELIDNLVSVATALSVRGVKWFLPQMNGAVRLPDSEGDYPRIARAPKRSVRLA